MGKRTGAWFIGGALAVCLVGCGGGEELAQGQLLLLTPSGLSPPVVYAGLGESVTFRNDDAVRHRIVADGRMQNDLCEGLQSPALETGESYTYLPSEGRTCFFRDALTDDTGFSGAVVPANVGPPPPPPSDGNWTESK